MRKLENCVVENCIPTPISCSFWNSGDIPFLGICNGDPVSLLLSEIITKLQELAGEDLSQFELDALLDICNQKAPTEVTLISILNVIKQNQVCLKDFVNTLSEQIASITNQSSTSVNLKCYTAFDNLGNTLSITKDQLDQLVIDNLCNHKQRIEGLEGVVTNLQSQINNINTNQTVEELNISTCIDATSKPTSSQVIAIAQELCDLEASNGAGAAISAALAKTPGTDNARYSSITGWVLVPANWAQNYGNLLLKVANLESRIIFMEGNCCAISCDDIKLGFSAVYNEDMDGLILTFSWGAGTTIPSGFTDQGSTGTITDALGNAIDFNITIANNAQVEIPITGIDTSTVLDISINAKIGNGSTLCQKCIGRKVTSTGCKYCEITASGSSGATAVIVYEIEPVISA